MRQVHEVKARTPLARTVESLTRLQVQVAVLAELAERTKHPELVAQATAIYDAAESAIHQAKGRH